MSKYKKCDYLEETFIEVESATVLTPCTACMAKHQKIPCLKKQNPYHVTATCWKVRGGQ